MVFEDLGDDVLVIAGAIAVPVARQAGETVEALEGHEEGIFLGPCQVKQGAVHVEDDGGLTGFGHCQAFAAMAGVISMSTGPFARSAAAIASVRAARSPGRS